MAVKGDPAAPVNRGLTCGCGRGHSIVKLLEVELIDLMTPLLRVNDKGEFDKKGKFKTCILAESL